jgi:uncharacterized protein YbaA (DUF1428 family)
MYVDGFVFAVPTAKINAYKKIASEAGKIWMKHGALSYVECIGEDIKKSKMAGLFFPDMVKLKKGQKVGFSYITYKSRKHRDQVNKKVFADPIMNQWDEKSMPVKMDQMSYGGFETIVQY